MFRWLKQSLPRILTDSLEPCHSHQLNGFHKPLPYFRHMLCPGPAAPWLKHLSYIYDLQGSAIPLNILYINRMILSRIFLVDLFPFLASDTYFVVYCEFKKSFLYKAFFNLLKVKKSSNVFHTVLKTSDFFQDFFLSLSLKYALHLCQRQL